MTDIGQEAAASAANRTPKEYRLVDWSAIPEKLVEAVRTGYFPHAYERANLIERLFLRWDGITKETMAKIDAAITTTQWPQDATTDQRRVMRLVLRAEDMVERLYSDAGSCRALLDAYPEIDVCEHLREIAIGAHQLIVAAEGGEVSPRLRCTVDSEAELAARVGALERFEAAVREDRAIAA